MQRSYTLKPKASSKFKKFMHWVDNKLCNSNDPSVPKRNSTKLPINKEKKHQQQQLPLSATKSKDQLSNASKTAVKDIENSSKLIKK